MKYPFFFTVLIVAILFGCQTPKQKTLVKKGKSNYEIVVLKNADTIVKNAALELQRYIKKISGALLPIKSNSTAQKIKVFVNKELKSNHTISIVVKNKNIEISGGNSESTRYAVYEFLEKQLGCKWFSPEVEKIPFTPTIVIANSLNYNYTPSITTRTVHSNLFYKHNTFANKQKVTNNAFPNYVPTARVHTFHKFIPEKMFYKKHPEYFALRGNKRLPTQLCLTNKNVLKIINDSVKANFKRYPKNNVISVSQNDNTQYCQCEKCSKVDAEEGSPSGTMIRFVNAVAKQFPNKTISTLAYQYTRKASKTKPLPNVLITLCSIECDRSAPIDKKCVDFSEDLKQWKQITQNIRIWDYTTQFTNFLAPFPNIHTLQPNIKFFANNNATWVFEQHSNHPSELFELRSYLTAKLLWNPNENTDAIIDEFLKGYYEEAGVFIKQYIDLIHQELKKDNNFFLYLYGDPSQAFSSFLKPSLLQQYNTLFNKAEEVVSTKKDVLQRVQIARLSTDYAMLEMAKSGMSKDFLLLQNNGVSKDVIKRLHRFKKSSQMAKATLMNEMGYTTTEYVNDFKKTIQRASKPNKAKGKKVTLLTNPKKYANENPQTLTDGAYGGTSFYANWLGFEGNDMVAVIDLGKTEKINHISAVFLQVTNHIVFFPKNVNYAVSTDGKIYKNIANINSLKPISKNSKINDVEYFSADFSTTSARFIKISAKNVGKAPIWHNASGLPVWIFVDEITVY